MHEWLHAQLPPQIQWCVLLPRANVLTFFNYTNYSAIKLYFQAQNNHLHPSLYNLLPRNNKTGIQCIWKALNSVQASVFHLTQNITRKTCLWYSRCAHQLFLLQQQSRRVKWQWSGWVQKRSPLLIFMYVHFYKTMEWAYHVQCKKALW